MKKEEHDLIQTIFDLILKKAIDVNDQALIKLAKIGLIAINSMEDDA